MRRHLLMLGLLMVAQLRRPNLSNALRQRTTDRERIADQTASTTSIGGFLTINGPGEALYDIPFPVIYTEKPLLSYSYDLEDGQVLDGGNFPVLSIGVHFFTFTETPSGIRSYTGARMIIVATGHDLMQMNIHYRFEGIALANPTVPSSGFL